MCESVEEIRVWKTADAECAIETGCAANKEGIAQSTVICSDVDDIAIAQTAETDGLSCAG